jgi:TonB family protein
MPAPATIRHPTGLATLVSACLALQVAPAAAVRSPDPFRGPRAVAETLGAWSRQLARSSTCTDADALCPIRVEGEVTQPGLLHRDEPDPDTLRDVVRRTRTCRGPLLEAVITRHGTVTAARILRTSGSPEMDGLYVQALRRWRFRPATLHGRPVDVYFTLIARICCR